MGGTRRTDGDTAGSTRLVGLLGGWVQSESCVYPDRDDIACSNEGALGSIRDRSGGAAGKTIRC